MVQIRMNQRTRYDPRYRRLYQRRHAQITCNRVLAEHPHSNGRLRVIHDVGDAEVGAGVDQCCNEALYDEDVEVLSAGKRDREGKENGRHSGDDGEIGEQQDQAVSCKGCRPPLEG